MRILWLGAPILVPRDSDKFVEDTYMADAFSATSRFFSFVHSTFPSPTVSFAVFNGCNGYIGLEQTNLATMLIKVFLQTCELFLSPQSKLNPAFSLFLPSLGGQTAKEWSELII